MPDKKNDVSRHWGTIIYPESEPDFLGELEDLHLVGFLSPLHDRDLLEDGSLKKPHFHFMCSFEGKKTRKQMLDLFTSFGGVGAECVFSPRSYARYLCHLDESDSSKALYSTSDVRCFGGADYSQFLSEKKDIRGYVREMMAWVRENRVTCFCDLMDFAAEENENWFQSLLDSTSQIMIAYIKSLAWKHDCINYNKKVGSLNHESGLDSR